LLFRDQLVEQSVNHLCYQTVLQLFNAWSGKKDNIDCSKVFWMLTKRLSAKTFNSVSGNSTTNIFFLKLPGPFWCLASLQVLPKAVDSGLIHDMPGY
jgi:hypothetical protein